MTHPNDPQRNIETARAALGALSPPRADDRDEFAWVNRQVDGAQRVDGGAPVLAVAPAGIL